MATPKGSQSPCQARGDGGEGLWIGLGTVGVLSRSPLLVTPGLTRGPAFSSWASATSDVVRSSSVTPGQARGDGGVWEGRRLVGKGRTWVSSQPTLRPSHLPSFHQQSATRTVRPMAMAAMIGEPSFPAITKPKASAAATQQNAYSPIASQARKSARRMNRASVTSMDTR